MIAVMWSCHECGVEKRGAEVRDRGPEEVITDYVEAVARVCGAAHARVSPACPSRQVDLYLPLRVRRRPGRDELARPE